MSSPQTHCHAHMVVGHVYKSVVNDTIAAARSYFLDEGVDEQVLQELKQLWESKLALSRAVPAETEGATAGGQHSSPSKPRPKPPAAPTAAAPTQSLVPIQITIPPQGQGGESKTIVVQVPVSAVQSGLAGQHLQTILSSPAAQATFALPPDVASNVLQRQLNDALRQQQLSGQMDGGEDEEEEGRGGRQEGAAGGSSQVAVGDEENSAELSASVTHAVTAVLDDVSNPSAAVFTDLASAYAASCSQTSSVISSNKSSACTSGGESASADATIPSAALSVRRKTPVAVTSASCSSRQRRADARLARRCTPQLVLQLDGVGDSSDSDDADDADDALDDDDDLDDGLDDDDDDEQGQEEEPLNSEDDVSDHEPTDLKETSNVIVCLYDKITRSRNKWKFYLKDGIMNLDGKDYIFQKANGDAEW